MNPKSYVEFGKHVQHLCLFRVNVINIINSMHCAILTMFKLEFVLIILIVRYKIIIDFVKF